MIDSSLDQTLTRTGAPAARAAASADVPITPDPWLLIAEIEHRVTNEYAVAISSISRAAVRAGSAEARATLDGAVERLRCYAEAHRALQAPVTRERRDLADHLRTLCHARVMAGLAERGIELTLLEQSVLLEADRCWRVGLIVSELITNAMRHAFNRRGGLIVVDLEVIGPELQCRVSDDGRSTAGASPGGGSRIIDALARDLGGSVERRFGSHGATVVLTIPL